MDHQQTKLGYLYPESPDLEDTAGEETCGCEINDWEPVCVKTNFTSYTFTNKCMANCKKGQNKIDWTNGVLTEGACTGNLSYFKLLNYLLLSFIRLLPLSNTTDLISACTANANHHYRYKQNRPLPWKPLPKKWWPLHRLQERASLRKRQSWQLRRAVWLFWWGRLRERVTQQGQD